MGPAGHGLLTGLRAAAIRPGAGAPACVRETRARSPAGSGVSAAPAQPGLPAGVFSDHFASSTFTEDPGC